tara:strand:+ start:1163 stop:1423 length:261 start_codon:yes stop_codon:yes gene_type:complete
LKGKIKRETSYPLLLLVLPLLVYKIRDTYICNINMSHYLYRYPGITIIIIIIIITIIIIIIIATITITIAMTCTRALSCFLFSLNK